MKRTLTITWKRLALLPLVGLAGALLVGGSGLVSIAANTGHFPPVAWFLHWTLERAVATQSLGTSLPEEIDLADPALVQRAAGHFASGCAPCHGAPGVRQSPVTDAMTPKPPRLERQVGEWADRELFWIGLHGIKYSGMPSWTTQERPDEVWSMVAFLRALPEMTAEEYADLALGAAAGEGLLRPAGLVAAAPGVAFEDALADCARCHGEDGHGVGVTGAFPRIAGQSETYLFATLQAFAANRRQSGIMEPAAGIHDEATLRRLAAHYASQPAEVPPERAMPAEPVGIALGYEGALRLPRSAIGPGAPPAEPPAGGPAAAGGLPDSAAGLLDLGRRIAEEGLPERKLPACDSCHGAEGREKNPHYPSLAGLPEWYQATHLQLWKDGHRGGTPYAHVMDTIAIHLTEEQIDAVAFWYARQPAGE